jgi:hypothetical protein
MLEMLLRDARKWCRPWVFVAFFSSPLLHFDDRYHPLVDSRAKFPAMKMLKESDDYHGTLCLFFLPRRN